MRLFHSSDIHLSFSGEVPGLILKPMDQRSWSKGSPNYVNYLEKIKSDARELGVAPLDLWFITGDILHDMSKKHVPANLAWINDELPGIKVLCRGNHDHQLDFGQVRFGEATGRKLDKIIMVEEGSFTCYGNFLIGCFSDHRNAWGDGQGNQPAFSNTEKEVCEMAQHFVKMAKIHKKVPIMISHYPCTEQVAAAIGAMGIKLYVSGHVHCTSNKVEGGTDWSWYDKSAALTDDKFSQGCFFSTGTTDVLLNRTGKMIKELTHRLPHSLQQPNVKQPQAFKAPASPAERMIVLSGLPGSGKSTWADEFLKTNDFVLIRQDALGSRGACLNACEQALAKGKSVIIDRVNFDDSYQQRGVWVATAKKYRVKRVEAVHFQTHLHACISRVLLRKGHASLNDEIPAERKIEIVKRFDAQLTEPKISEGFHGITIVV